MIFVVEEITAVLLLFFCNDNKESLNLSLSTAYLCVCAFVTFFFFTFTVREKIGPIATPDFIQNAPALPKTRSGNNSMLSYVIINSRYYV